MNQKEKQAAVKALHAETNDYFMRQYMDPDSDALLDWKLEVLQALKAGKRPPEIAHYDDVMDLYPEKEEAPNLDVQF